MQKNFFKKSLVFAMGTCLITCLTLSNSASLKKKVKLNHSTATIKVGDKLKLKAINTSKKVSWKSSQTKVATISNKGIVSAKKVGKTTITAKVGKKSLTCKIKVVKKNSSAGAASTPTQKPQVTAKPTAKPTKKPDNSIISHPTEDPNKRDEGWIPGWY